jgi:hypothetical protein
MTVRRAHREAYDILLSNLPEGLERDRQLRRFEAGALAENEGALFAKSFPEKSWNERWDALGKDLPSEASPEPDGERAARVTIAGRTLPFRQGEDGGWGFAGLAAEAEEAKRRATADLELVRTNAADLERAATRAGR